MIRKENAMESISKMIKAVLMIVLFVISTSIPQVAAQTCVQPPSGLVSWWSGDGNANDIQDGNNGTLAGGATFSPGMVDQAFSLSGGGYVAVANAPNLNPSYITVDAWVYANSFNTLSGGGGPPIVKKAEPGYGLETNRNWNGTGALVFGVYLSSGWAMTPRYTLTTGAWYHVAGTYDGSTVKLYVNGTLVAQSGPATGSIVAGTPSLWIGRDPADPNRFWDGHIDEVEVFNRALTASEINSIYNAGSAGKCKGSAGEIEVEIDIKPGSDPNSINPRSKGVIPVAILTTDSFDATTVDPTTVLFGSSGTEAAPMHSALEDVDGDGDTDIILHFNTQDTGIVCGNTTAYLKGETLIGQEIEGADSIKTVGCK